MLLIETTSNTFNLDEIGRGTLIYAKHSSWDDWRTGIVTGADTDQIRVQFPPTVQNTLNHFFIYATEVVGGYWEIRYSNDLLEISSYPEEEGDDD